jgi:hypothetical protein
MKVIFKWGGGVGAGAGGSAAAVGSSAGAGAGGSAAATGSATGAFGAGRGLGAGAVLVQADNPIATSEIEVRVCIPRSYRGGPVAATPGAAAHRGRRPIGETSQEPSQTECDLRSTLVVSLGERSSILSTV